MAKNTVDKIQQKDREQIAKALEILFAADYINKHKLYLENFIRGMVFAAGGVIGATLLIAVLVGILSLFDRVPLVGPFIDNTKQTIQDSQNSR